MPFICIIWTLNSLRKNQERNIISAHNNDSSTALQGYHPISYLSLTIRKPNNQGQKLIGRWDFIKSIQNPKERSLNWVKLTYKCFNVIHKKVKQFGETKSSVLLLCCQTQYRGTNYASSKNFGPLPCESNSPWKSKTYTLSKHWHVT